MSVGTCIIHPLTCAVSGVSGFTFSAFFSSASSWVQSSATWAWDQLGGWLQTTSDSAVVTTAASPVFNSLLAISPFVALCAMVANVLTSLRRIDPMALVRDIALAMPLVILAIFMSRPLAVVILDVVNALGAGPSRVAGQALTQLTHDAVTMPGATPAFGALLLAVGEVIGAVMLWFELIIRNAVLALLLCLAPVIFAAAVWTPLRRLALRLVETFIAVALAKFVVVVALALGASATQSHSVTVILTGIAVVFLAVWAPFTLLRIVPLVEHSALHAMEGMRQRATSAGRRAAGLASAGVAKMSPYQAPGPPERSDDLGLEMWPESDWPEVPEWDGVEPVPPIGEPYLRTGHVAYMKDHLGPVLGWHFDE